jgi:hypothetical protein
MEAFEAARLDKLTGQDGENTCELRKFSTFVDGWASPRPISEWRADASPVLLLREASHILRTETVWRWPLRLHGSGGRFVCLPFYPLFWMQGDDIAKPGGEGYLHWVPFWQFVPHFLTE